MLACAKGLPAQSLSCLVLRLDHIEVTTHCGWLSVRVCERRPTRSRLTCRAHHAPSGRGTPLGAAPVCTSD